MMSQVNKKGLGSVCPEYMTLVTIFIIFDRLNKHSHSFVHLHKIISEAVSYKSSIRTK